MINKSLEQYKEEFSVFYQEEMLSGRMSEKAQEHEMLAKDCIASYPDADLGYIEYANSLIEYSEYEYKHKYKLDFSHSLEVTRNVANKFNELAALTKNDSRYIQTLETIVQSESSLVDLHHIYRIERAEYANLYFLCGKFYAQRGEFNEAAFEFELAWKLGNDSEKKLSFINPPLNNITIEGKHCIKNLSINEIGECKEIYFLGENGVGKTLLLQSVVRNIGNKGIAAWGNEQAWVQSYQNLFAYGTARYRTGLVSDDYFDETGVETLFDRNLLLTDVEWWLKDLQRKEFLNTTKISLDTALNLLKEVVNFEEGTDFNITFDPRTDKFGFVERGTIVDFENIADGFRSVLIWLCDLLRRLMEYQPYIEKPEDFYGVVLIDEIDMFLHPKWEHNIVRKLRKKLPNIQWFLTTHSPLLILGASEDAVFYKLYKEDGETKISEQWKCRDIDNMLANSILTSPLFDLETARMSVFDETEKELDTSTNYYYSQIAKIIKQERTKQSAEGKKYFRRDEIDEIVRNAISQFTKAENND